MMMTPSPPAKVKITNYLPTPTTTPRRVASLSRAANATEVAIVRISKTSRRRRKKSRRCWNRAKSRLGMATTKMMEKRKKISRSRRVEQLVKI